MHNTKRRGYRRKNRSRRKKIKQLGGNGIYSIMSYNVLAKGATTHQESAHNFHFDNNSNEITGKPSQSEHIEQTIQRFEKIIKEIEQNNPDIVLLQEVDNYFYTYLLKHLPSYTGYFKLFIPNTRGDLSSNFATAIIWNSSKFSLIKGETLDSESYYQDNPTEKEEHEKQNIKSPFDNKNATLITLEKTTEPKPDNNIAVVSLHLPGDKEKKNLATPSKQRLISYILQKLENNNAKLKVIGGDFNCPITTRICETTVDNCCYEWIYNEMKKNGFEIVNHLDTSTTCAFDYSSTPNYKTNIDTIFYSKDSMKINNYSVQTMVCKDGESSVYKKSENGYADINHGSDHAWILADLEKLIKT